MVYTIEIGKKMSNTMKDRPQPRREPDEVIVRRERPKRSNFRRTINQFDLDDSEAWDELDELDNFEKM